MSAKNIFIEPTDVWLFRDARPFAAGEQNRAMSIFPPTPRTIQGAIRSARLAQSGESFDYRNWSDALKAEIGQPDNFGALHLRGPLLARQKENGVAQRFFLQPMDVVKLQSGWHILSPERHLDFQANWKSELQPLMQPDGEEPEKFESGWLCQDGLLAYLCGNQRAIDVHSSGDLFQREPRFGVQIDSNPKRPVEGMLYQVEFIRLREDVGLLVEVAGVSLNDVGLLQLGGESRSGRYKSVATGLDLPIEGRLKDEEKPLRFKLYLAIPALFNQGWLPDAIDAQTLAGTWRGIKLKLISAATGKPQPIGGRDISKQDSQRDVHRAVPAGSVYFFEAEDTTTQDVLDAFDGKCVSDMDAQIGFGLCYVGGW